MFWRKRTNELAEIKAELAVLEGRVWALVYAVSVKAALMPTEDLAEFDEKMRWLIGTRMATKKPVGAAASLYPQVFRDSMSGMMQAILEDTIAVVLEQRRLAAAEASQDGPPAGGPPGRSSA